MSIISLLLARTIFFPSRAKRVTFDVWARSFCVHIITRWWRFAWFCEWVCLLKTCRTFIFFLRNARWRFFPCAAVSRCARCDVSVWHYLRRPKSLPFAPPDGVTFGFLEGGVKRVSFCFFSVRCQHWQGFWMCVLMWVRFLLNRFLTVWVCFDFWPHLSNTILAYFLTSSHFLFRLLQRSINWLIENLLLYSVICYNSSSLTAINKKNIKTPLVVHVGKFCRLFLLCMCMWVCVVVVWTGVRLVSNYIFFCLFFFSIFLFF